MKKALVKTYLAILKLIGVKTTHFIHIGKTGGSAIRNSFNEESKLVGNHLLSYPYLFKMHTHDFKLTDAAANEFVFFVVREPVSRFISGFFSRLREGKPKNYNPWTEKEAIAFKRFETPNALAEALSSDDEATKTAAIEAMQSIGHVKTSYWDWFIDEEYLQKNKNRILYVLDQGNLNSDFDAMKKKFGLKIKSLTNDPVKSHRNSESFDKKLSDTALANLRNWYAREYEFINYIQQLGLLKKN